MIMTLDMTFHKIDISDFKITRKSVVRIIFQTLELNLYMRKIRFKGIPSNLEKVWAKFTAVI